MAISIAALAVLVSTQAFSTPLLAFQSDLEQQHPCTASLSPRSQVEDPQNGTAGAERESGCRVNALPADPSTRRAPVSSLAPTSTLIVSAESAGSWNIYSADPKNNTWGQILANAVPARDPALSPDGATIAYRSNRDGTWAIYTSPTDSNLATRLTSGMIFSGAPAWSPDGKRIAFESYAHGDLDIWTMNADGTQPVDLTDDSKAYEYGPAWSPDGQWIAFTSWRTGAQHIFIVSPDCAGVCKATDISQDDFDDEQPTWSPDGKKLAFVSDRDGQRAIYVADFADQALKNIRRLTFSGWDDQPAWSPDGAWIAFVSARPTRQPVYVVPANGGIARLVDHGPAYASSVVWTTGEAVPVESTPSDPAALYTEQPDLAAPGTDHPVELRRITSTRLNPGINKLNSLVANSFVALQTQVIAQVGYDFLAVMSDMNRPVDMLCDITCDSLSWHKAGRAWDTRFDYSDPRGIGGLEIVREDQQGETFWRVFLRAAAQDGTMGEPLTEAPWDLSYNARWIVGRGEGGMKKPLPRGMYVDFTEWAQQYGWVRISSHDNPDFNWKTDVLGAEYWHFQKTADLDWYHAMRQIYSQNDLKSVSDWNSLDQTAGYDPYLLDLKGISKPPTQWQWSSFGP